MPTRTEWTGTASELLGALAQLTGGRARRQGELAGPIARGRWRVACAGRRPSCARSASTLASSARAGRGRSASPPRHSFTPEPETATVHMVRTVRQSAVTQSGQITTATPSRDRPLRRDKNKPTRLSKGLIACSSGMCRCFSARRSRISSDLPTVKSASASLRGDCRRSRRKSHRGNADSGRAGSHDALRLRACRGSSAAIEVAGHPIFSPCHPS